MRLFPLLLATLIALPALGGGLRAPFTGARMTGMTRNTTVLEYHGRVDTGGNLIDFSGSNLLTYSEQFDQAGTWTVGNSTISADQDLAPIGVATTVSDILQEDDTGASIHEVTADVAVTAGVVYSASVYVKANNRTWVRLVIDEAVADPTVSYNLSTGIVGTSTNTDKDGTHLVAGYRRCWFTWTASTTETVTFHIQVGEADNDVTFDGEDQDSLYLFGAQVSQNDRWRTGPGVYLRTAADPKPLHDLAPTNAPTQALVSLQSKYGNKLPARGYNGTNQEYSEAHHANFNVFDGDHTLTMTIMRDSAAAGDDYILQHGAFATAGMLFFAEAANWRASYHSGGVAANVLNSMTTADGCFHVVQLVRSSDTATLYVDGTAGTPVDVTTEGIDGNYSLFLGGTAAQWEGQIGYTRLDTEALPVDELNQQKDILLGMASWTGFQYPNWTFSRSTIAYGTFSAGEANPRHPKMSVFAVDIPRVAGRGGGVLIEGQGTNLCLQSEDFDTTWTKVELTSVDTNADVALDGTTTADGLVADADDESHGVSQAITLTAVDYTFSVYAKAGDQDWIYMADSKVVNATAYFNVDIGLIGTVGAGATAGIENLPDGWCRCWITYTGTVAAHTHLIYSAPADADNTFAGDASTTNTTLWGAQVELGMFPSSYIATTTTSATRTADDLSMDPHEAGTTRIVLPEEFNSTTYADKLTVYIEAKGLYASAADIGVTRRLINIGDSTSANNDFELYVHTDGRVYLSFTDNGGTVRTINSAVHTFYDSWFSVRVIVDFADLSRSELYVNETIDHATDANMTGTATFDTTDCLLRLGADRQGSVDGFNRIRKLRINLSEIRP